TVLCAEYDPRVDHRPVISLKLHADVGFGENLGGGISEVLTLQQVRSFRQPVVPNRRVEDPVRSLRPILGSDKRPVRFVTRQIAGERNRIRQKRTAVNPCKWKRRYARQALTNEFASLHDSSFRNGVPAAALRSCKKIGALPRSRAEGPAVSSHAREGVVALEMNSRAARARHCDVPHLRRSF